MNASAPADHQTDDQTRPDFNGAMAQAGSFFPALAPALVPALAPFAAWSQAALEYGTDAWQRSVLLLDILRQRGNESAEHEREGMPPVLVFDYEVLADA